MLKEYRMALHQIPEIGFNEYKTSEYIFSIIKDYDCVINTVKTGFVLFFDNGYDYSLAFRTDIDALPIKEETSLSFKSTNGYMHACGHDGHMAIMLGLAKYVNEHKKDIKRNIVIIFQPSEEIVGGSKSIVDSGYLTKYNVKAIFGLHIWPNLEDGVLYTRYHELMAKSGEVDVIIHGKSAHAASSDKAIDALKCGVLFLDNMYKIESAMRPQIKRILKFGKIESGVIRNVISDYTHIYGTLRAYDEEVFSYLKDSMYLMASDLEKKFGCKFEINVNEGYPPVINDESLVKKAMKVANIKIIDNPVMQAEDFGLYGNYIPSMFMFLGNSNTIPLHNSKYDFNMDILDKGLETFVKLLDIEL